MSDRHASGFDRRGLLVGSATSALLGIGAPAAASLRRFARPQPLVPIAATPDRLMRVTVCLRPFRAAGPRIEAEDVAGKRVIHNYGHGGSGWSLSWGSALEAVSLAPTTGARDVAVIGAGAIGLTTAVTAQRMGARVTIYAKDRHPLVHSSNATGTWSPDSRLAMRNAVSGDFAARWERMMRVSYIEHQRFLGLASQPVEWTDRYELFDRRPGADSSPDVGLIGFGDRMADMAPRVETLQRRQHPFRAPFVQRSSSLTFNVTPLMQQLEMEFLAAGGRFVTRQFHAPAEVAQLDEAVVINCTGYGARRLWRDETVEPMRGQIAWLPPQEGATYGVHYRQLYLLARRDGIVLFRHGLDDLFGYRDDDERPDRASALAAVSEAAAIFGSGPA